MMQVFSLFGNIARAAIGTALTPVAAVVDVCRLPSTAYDGKHPFELTKNLAKNVGRCVNEITRPNDSY